MTGVIYDAVGAGANGVNVSGSPAAGTPFNITAAIGADVCVAIQMAGATVETPGNPPTNVELNGATMTLDSFQPVDNLSASAGTYVYRAAGAGNGSAQSVTYIIPTGVWYLAGAVSATGVGSAGTAITNSGLGTALSSGSIPVSTGQLAVCFYGSGYASAKTISALTGGTNRYSATTSTPGEANLAISTATATATFGATASGTIQWSSVAIVLSPPSGTVDTPAAASVTVAPGTPDALDPVIDIPASASIPPSAGTPVVADIPPSTVVPAPATVPVSSGTPDALDFVLDIPAPATTPVSPGAPDVFSGNPFYVNVVAPLIVGRSTSFCVFGDSTGAGAFDTSTAPFLYGWTGRLAVDIATALYEELGISVNVQAIGVDGTSDSDEGWGSATTLYTPPTGSGSAPTLTLYNGAVSGSTIAADDVYIADDNLLEFAAGAGAIITCDGFNDIIANNLSVSTFVSRYKAFVASIQSAAPGVPVIVTTQNQTPDAAQSEMYAAFTALAEAFVGTSLPLTPPLQASTTNPGVYMLDTQQAFNGLVLTSITNSGGTGYDLHPNDEGYDLYAAWAMAWLAPGLPQTWDSPAGAEVAPTGGRPDVINAASTATVVTPPGADIDIASGTPDAVDPIADAPAPAAIVTTGGTPEVVDPIADVPAQADIDITSGTPDAVVRGQGTLVPAPAAVGAAGGEPDVVMPIDAAPLPAEVAVETDAPLVVNANEDLSVSPDPAAVAAIGGAAVVTVSFGVRVPASRSVTVMPESRTTKVS